MILYTSKFKQQLLQLYEKGFGKKYNYSVFINIRIREMRSGLNDPNGQVNTLQNT